MTSSKMYSLLISVVACVFCLILPSAGQEDIIVNAASPLAFTFPCANDPKLLVMNYAVQQSNNNWEGVFYMDRFRDVFSVRLKMVLDNPANIILKNTQGNVHSNDNMTFIISTFKNPPEIRRIEFRVIGLSFGFFPHLMSLRFGEETLCDNSGRDLSSPFLKKSQACGKAVLGKTKPLISEAYDAAVGKWPWHVAMYHKKGDNDKEYKCGGTLINSNTVLTAAHCMFDSKQTGRVLPANEYILHFGKNKLSQHENVKEVKVRNVILNEEYEGTTLRADIGILKLDSHIEFTDYIQPICLWDELPTRDLIEKTGIVVGWGFTEKGNIPAENLREASMPVIGTTVCLASNRPVFGTYLSDTNFCAGYRNGTSVCSGDSGSGMYIETNGLWRIRGIVSLGVTLPDVDVSTCNPRDYVLFTDVLVFINWIKDKAN